MRINYLILLIVKLQLNCERIWGFLHVCLRVACPYIFYQYRQLWFINTVLKLPFVVSKVSPQDGSGPTIGFLLACFTSSWAIWLLLIPKCPGGQNIFTFDDLVLLNNPLLELWLICYRLTIKIFVSRVPSTISRLTDSPSLLLQSSAFYITVFPNFLEITIFISSA